MIFRLLEECRVSIHDLSRVGVPVRFNMPFELGLAFALTRYWGRHDWYVLEARAFRVQKTLSDLKVTEEHVHGNGPKIVISCVLDALGTTRRDPDPAEVDALRRKMVVVAENVKRQYGRKNAARPAPEVDRAANLHEPRTSARASWKGSAVAARRPVAPLLVRARVRARPTLTPLARPASTPHGLLARLSRKASRCGLLVARTTSP